MRRLLCVGLFFACLVLPYSIVTADDVPDAATLHARVRTASGPDPDNYRETITWTLADGSLAKQQTFQVGKDRRVTLDVGGIHSERGTFNGDAWHQNDNGLTVINEPDPLASKGPAKERGVVRSVMSPAPLLEIADVNSQGLGDKEYVDPASYHIVRDEWTDRGGTTTTTYTDFRQYGAQTLAAHWTDADVTGSTQYTRVERVPGAATAADVAVPGVRRLLVEFPGTSPVQIPAKFEAGRIYVHTTINGHPYDMQLDSGSSVISIVPAAAKQIGLSLVNRRVNANNARPEDESNAVVSELKIGSLTMHNIVVSTDSIKNDDPGIKFGGLLGFDFFATLGVTVDYEHQRVIVAPAATYQPPADKNTVPVDIRLGSQVPMVTVGLDGVPASRFIVDTGASLGAFAVFDYFMDRHPNVGERSSQPIDLTGVGGDITVRPIFVHSFRLGTYNFQDFNGLRLGGGSYSAADDGLIGTEFLVLFNIDFDYPHGEMYLTPTTNTKQMLHLR